jgi:[ribosomal protein S18]-alanine N-acetyltransferase
VGNSDCRAHLFHSNFRYSWHVLYRLYQPADFEPLYAVEDVCFQPPFRFSRSLMHRIIGGSNSATWIAEDNGSIVGFAVVEWTVGPIRSAYIQTIEVLPDLRRRGAANELMRRIEGSAIDAGAELIWLHVDSENQAAIRLYEKEGFALQGREVNYYPRGRDALIFKKPLARVGP